MVASDREELAGIAEDLRGHLEWLRENGVDALPAPPRPQAAPAAAVAAGAPASQRPAAGPAPAGSGNSLRAAVRAVVGAPEAQSRPAAPAPAAKPASIKAPPATEGSRFLEQIRAELSNCQRCKLAGSRTQLVFGQGNPAAELVFVGEAPGDEEDRQGTAFVGPAGELLTRMIEAMGLSREEVYLCNVVKCRPPASRPLAPEESATCEPFLAAQLACLRPKVIVALGKVASQVLLRTQTPITQLRGNWHEYRGIRLMPTFHPAYLVRSPAEKRKVWEDLKLVMKELGRDPAGPQR